MADIESYLEDVRGEVKDKLSKQEFTGSVTAEVNIKNGAVQNMNLWSKRSIKKD